MLFFSIAVWATQVETALRRADSEQIRGTASHAAACDAPWPKNCKPFRCPDWSVNNNMCVTRQFGSVRVEPPPTEATPANPEEMAPPVEPAASEDVDVASEDVEDVAERRGAWLG